MKKLYTLIGMLAIGMTANAQIVINELYVAGGSNAEGAAYKNDYVILKNIGTTTETLSGATLQSSGSRSSYASEYYLSVPDKTLAPGETYLIEMTPPYEQTVGEDVPKDKTNYYYLAETYRYFTNVNDWPGGFPFDRNDGKVALVKDNVKITKANDANVLDFVAYGTRPRQYEGSAPAATPAVSQSLQRNGGDTNDNKNDFIADTPFKTLSITQYDAFSSVNLVKNTFVTDKISFTTSSKIDIFNMNGQLVQQFNAKEGELFDVSHLNSGIYLVKGQVGSRQVTQKIVKK